MRTLTQHNALTRTLGTLCGFHTRPKFHLRMKCLEVICSYLTRSWTHVFVIVKTNAFGIDEGKLVLGLFYILNILFSAGTPLLSFLKDCYLV